MEDKEKKLPESNADQKKDWKVCIYAICKDEMKFLDKWLESMSEADYIVVLDTGSTDGSYEYLQKDPRCTKVVQKVIKPWRFDVARNESLTLCPEDTDIFVCTDPDEVFEPGWCKILKRGWSEGVNRGFYAYAWSHDESGGPLNVFRYDKIHSHGYHWKYPIHEVLWPDNNSLATQVCVDFGEKIYLHHWQDLSKDRKNYLDILKIAVDENPGDCHIFHLYAREYILQQQPEEARRLFLRLLLMEHIGDPIYAEVRIDSLLMLQDLSFRKGDYEETIYWANEFLKLDESFREPYIMCANVYNVWGDYNRAKDVIDTMYKKCKRHFSWVEKNANWSYSPHITLSDSEFGLGNYEESLKHIEVCLKHEPNSLPFLKRKIACLENMKK